MSDLQLSFRLYQLAHVNKHLVPFEPRLRVATNKLGRDGPDVNVLTQYRRRISNCTAYVPSRDVGS